MNFHFALIYIETLLVNLEVLVVFFVRSTININTSIIIALLSCRRENKNELRSFKNKLKLEGKHHRDRRIPPIALQLPSCSAFSVLFVSGSDQALITMTGLDHRAFRYLLSKFSPIDNLYIPCGHDGHSLRLKKST